MSYQKTVWVNREIKKDRTYNLINNSDGTITLQDPPDNVLVIGTPINAENLNNIEDGIEYLEEKIINLKKIGEPVITLLNDLNNNEIWLEGAEVSKTTYSALYEIYGDTYGTPESEDNFILPDFRDRVIQGGEDFGYIEAGLPNITGSAASFLGQSGGISTSGAISRSSAGSSNAGTGSSGTYWYSGFSFNASNSDSIYGNSDTVQPPAIKVRVKTRYQ